MPLPFGELIAPVGQAISGIGSSIASVVNTNKTIKANKELAEYSYGKDLDMWNRANLYNDPSQQMQRLKNAGLNPNMVYGSGSATGNTASSLPKYNAPTQRYDYQPPDFTNVIGAYQDFKVKQAQTELLQSQKKAVDASAGLNSLRGTLLHDTLDAQKGLIGNKARFYEETFGDRKDLLTNQKLSEWERQAGMEQTRQFNKELQPYQMQSAQNKNKIEARQLDQMLANIQNTRQRTKTERAREKEKWVGLRTLGERQLWELENLISRNKQMNLGNTFQELENKYYIEKLAGEFIGNALGMLPKFTGSFRKK